MEKDVLYDEVKNFVIENQKASISSIQRRFRIGCNRCAAIMEMLEQNEVVTESLMNGKREILFKNVVLTQKQKEILDFFAFEHLPEKLQLVSRPIGELAAQMNEILPASAEKSAGMRKLLEAKDCFVRANL